MIVLLTIAWLVFAVAFVSTLYVEAKQTSWDLLEALIAANLLGHAVAYPVSKTIADPGHYFDGSLDFQIVIVALLATVVSACMAGGAVWVFRRMKMLGETRRWVRIGYMLLGLLLFPSMILFPFNLMFGWFVWGPLTNLNKEANLIAAARRKETREAQATLPGVPQHRYTVAWSKNSGRRMAEDRWFSA